MKKVQKYLLLVSFIIIQVLLFILSMFPVDDLGNVKYPSQAIGVHLIATIMFVLGYFCGIKNTEVKTDVRIKYIGRGYVYFALGFTFLGLVTSIASVISIISLSEYWEIISNGDVVGIKEIRNKMGTSGLPGYIKVFNYAPLGVFLVSSSYYYFYKFENEQYKNRLLMIILGTLIVLMFKVVFSLERLTLLAVLPVLILGIFRFPRKQKILLLFFLVVLVLMLMLVTKSRMGDRTLFSFFVLYANLGMLNFQLLIEYFNNWSYGLNTFLMPIYFIGKALGIEIEIPIAPLSIWGNPQYFFGYLYMDFGYFMFIIVALLGFLLARYQKLINEKKSWAIGFFFLTLFVIHSTMVIPIIRATEFWLLIIITLVGRSLLKIEK